METVSTLTNRLKEVLIDGQWVSGTNFKKEIENMSWQNAITPVANLNSVAAIIWHIEYYMKGVTSVLKGGTLDIKDKFSFDTPDFKSQTDWENLKVSFFKTCNTYISLITKLSKGQLNATFVDEKYGDYHRNVNAMIEHCYYHLGQIVLIKKLQHNSIAN